MKSTSNSLWATFVRTVALRPFGDRLLGSKAATWLAMAWVAVTQMAAVEGMAWGYAATLIAPDSVRIAAGWSVGLIVFVLVWGLDASLISLDRESARLNAVLSRHGSESRPVESGQYVVLAGALIRTIIVAISLFITAPFVSQYVFREEVDTELSRRSVESLRAARSEVIQKADTDLTAARIAFENAQRDLETEIAGTLTSGSGRYGQGPVADAIRERVESTRREFDLAKVSGTERVVLFDELVSMENWATLESSFSVARPQVSLTDRWSALETIRERPEHFWTEIAIRAILLLLFLSVVTLKIYEPLDLRFYLSAMVHEEHAKYSSGAYDNWIPDSDRRTGADIPLYRLVQLLEGVINEKRQQAAKNIVGSEKRMAAEGEINRLTNVLKEIEAESDSLDAQLKELDREFDRFGEAHDTSVAIDKKLKGDILAAESRLRELNNGGGHAVSEVDVILARSVLSTELSNWRTKQAESQSDAQRLAARQASLAQKRTRLERRMERQDALAEELSGRIAEFHRID